MQADFFYEIIISKIDVTTTIMRSLQSMSIVEEDGKLTTCNISLKAGHSSLLDKMIEGIECSINLGYREGMSVRQYFTELRPWEPAITRLIFHGEFGIPSIKLESNGLTSYAFTLHSKEVAMALDKKFKVWKNISRASIIQQIGLQYTDLKTVFSLFQTASIKLDKPEIQDNETDFAFLQRMAKKWGIVIKLDYNNILQGFELTAFDVNTVNPKKKEPYPLFWGEGLKSLKSLSFSPPQTQSKGGVTITPEKKGGKRIYKATEVLPDGSVVNYVLDESAIRRDMKTGDKTAVLDTILSAKNFSDPQIKKYWIPEKPKVNTKKPASAVDAPSAGTGGKYSYKASIELSYGDPIFTNTMDIKLDGKNIPPRLKGLWKVIKVTHNIATGFSTVAEIVR